MIIKKNMVDKVLNKLFIFTLALSLAFYTTLYQFKLPLPGEVLLVYSVLGMGLLCLYRGKVNLNIRIINYILIIVIVLIGCLYTPNFNTGFQQFILWCTFLLFLLSAQKNKSIVVYFARCFIFISYLVFFSVIIQFAIPKIFYLTMSRVMNINSFIQFSKAYEAGAYAGIGAYTPITSWC